MKLDEILEILTKHTSIELFTKDLFISLADCKFFKSELNFKSEFSEDFLVIKSKETKLNLKTSMIKEIVEKKYFCIVHMK